MRFKVLRKVMITPTTKLEKLEYTISSNIPDEAPPLV